jgi:(1->4)-alpha-D-glucan 1-alpha-D-glucosylmutase
LVAYMRGHSVITMVPRLVLKLGRNWCNTSMELPAGNWRNQLSGSVFRGGKLRVGDILRSFPVALLTKD